MKVRYRKPKQIAKVKSMLNFLDIFSFTCAKSAESLILMIADSKKHIKTKEHYLVVKNEIDLVHKNFMYSVKSNAIMAVMMMCLSIVFFDVKVAVSCISFVIIATLIEGRKIIMLEDTFHKIELDLLNLRKELFNDEN